MAYECGAAYDARVTRTIGPRIIEVRAFLKARGHKIRSSNLLSKVANDHERNPGWEIIQQLARELQVDPAVICAPVGAPIPEPHTKSQNSSLHQGTVATKVSPSTALGETMLHGADSSVSGGVPIFDPATRKTLGALIAVLYDALRRDDAAGASVGRRAPKTRVG